MTRKKAAVLYALSGQGAEDFRERGTPPYCARDVADAVPGDLSSAVKTLKLLERDGLVVREVAVRECWNAIAQQHLPRKVVCYWNTATMEPDKADAAQWRAGAHARSEAAVATIFDEVRVPGSVKVGSARLPLGRLICASSKSAN